MSQGKSPYEADELEAFRRRLLQRRREFLESFHALEHHVEEAHQPEARSVQSDVPTHPADQADFQQLQDLQIASTERDTIRRIEEALGRIEDGTYGICLTCGKPIDRRRLEAQPWAQMCKIDANPKFETRNSKQIQNRQTGNKRANDT
jgi:DnaK suppressor protein